MAQSYEITRVVLNWEAAYGSAYEIQVSDDGLSWSTIYSEANSDGGIDNLTDLSGSGRYIRMYGTRRNNDNWGYSLWEFEVYGTPTVGDKPKPPTSLREYTPSL